MKTLASRQNRALCDGILIAANFFQMYQRGTAGTGTPLGMPVPRGNADGCHANSKLTGLGSDLC